MIKIFYDNKEYSTHEFTTLINVKYNAFIQFIKRSWPKTNLTYHKTNFSIKNLKAVRTYINQHFKAEKAIYFDEKNQPKKEKIYNFWKKLTETYPTITEYQDFYQFLQLNENNKSFNYFKLWYKYTKRKEIWMCDTETTFEKVFLNNKKFREDEKQEILLKNLDVDGIKEYYKLNPDKKPYMWAWNSYNLKTKAYVLLNYYDACDYLNEYPYNVIHYYHNLSYDGLYVADALITEYNYTIFIKEPMEAEEEQEKQPRKSIYIFANNNKIISMKIVNNKGKTIEIECTYLKTMQSVETLGKYLGVPKEELNYLTARSKNHVFSKKEQTYIFKDVYIVATFLNEIATKYEKRFNKELKWELTVGATALKQLKSQVGKKEFKQNFVKTITSDEYLYLKQGTHGGYTNYSMKHLGKIHHNIWNLDIISSYPDKWQHYQLPYGKPIYNCPCDDNDLFNTSQHFKMYELTLETSLKILEGKENIIPFTVEALDNDQNTVTSKDYYPFVTMGTHYLSQYLVQAFLILFNPDKAQYQLKKTMCFEQKNIPGFKKYIDLWKQEKNNTDKQKDRPYYEFCKLLLNSPSGKYAQKPILDETIFEVSEAKHIIKTTNKDVKEIEDVEKFSYLPVYIATTDMGRLQVLSLIEAIGWEFWHNTDTDSGKFWLKDKWLPKNNPTYYNWINGVEETIYNPPGVNHFGKWELEPHIYLDFKCCGKKKYIVKWIETDEKGKNIEHIEVTCAGATKGIKKQMTFDNFFVGFESQGQDKNTRVKLNELPVIIPVTFHIKNVFKTKFINLLGFGHLLTPEYLKKVYELRQEVDINIAKTKNKTLTDFNYSVEDQLLLEQGVYS